MGMTEDRREEPEVVFWPGSVMIVEDITRALGGSEIHPTTPSSAVFLNSLSLSGLSLS